MYPIKRFTVFDYILCGRRLPKFVVQFRRFHHFVP